MSERLKSNMGQVSNESVVDELTKDLTKSLVTEDKQEESEEFIINPDSQTDDHGVASEIPLYDTDFDKDSENDEVESDSETIDEELLREEEKGLTDDQKEERRIIAEQLKEAGNDAFRVEDYDRSIEKYTNGLKLCPLQFTQQRAILYCNRAAANMKLKKYNAAIKDCTKAIELDAKYVKAYLRRSHCYETTDKLDECLADHKKILEINPTHRESITAVPRLEHLIEKKNERLKAEMMGKLKDLGNMILKPFGLSTDNFQMEQDPETKGYKINFKQ